MSKPKDGRTQFLPHPEVTSILQPLVAGANPRNLSIRRAQPSNQELLELRDADSMILYVQVNNEQHTLLKDVPAVEHAGGDRWKLKPAQWQTSNKSAELQYRSLSSPGACKEEGYTLTGKASRLASDSEEVIVLFQLRLQQGTTHCKRRRLEGPTNASEPAAAVTLTSLASQPTVRSLPIPELPSVSDLENELWNDTQFMNYIDEMWNGHAPEVEKEWGPSRPKAGEDSSTVSWPVQRTLTSLHPDVLRELATWLTEHELQMLGGTHSYLRSTMAAMVHNWIGSWGKRLTKMLASGRWTEAEPKPGIHDDFFHPFDPRRCTNEACVCGKYDPYAMFVFKCDWLEALAVAMDDYNSPGYPAAWSEHPHESQQAWTAKLLAAQATLRTRNAPRWTTKILQGAKRLVRLPANQQATLRNKIGQQFQTGASQIDLEKPGRALQTVFKLSCLVGRTLARGPYELMPQMASLPELALQSMWQESYCRYPLHQLLDMRCKTWSSAYSKFHFDCSTSAKHTNKSVAMEPNTQSAVVNLDGGPIHQANSITTASLAACLRVLSQHVENASLLQLSPRIPVIEPTRWYASPDSPVGDMTELAGMLRPFNQTSITSLFIAFDPFTTASLRIGESMAGGIASFVSGSQVTSAAVLLPHTPEAVKVVGEAVVSAKLQKWVVAISAEDMKPALPQISQLLHLSTRELDSVAIVTNGKDWEASWDDDCAALVEASEFNSVRLYLHNSSQQRCHTFVNGNCYYPEFYSYQDSPYENHQPCEFCSKESLFNQLIQQLARVPEGVSWRQQAASRAPKDPFKFFAAHPVYSCGSVRPRNKLLDHMMSLCALEKARLMVPTDFALNPIIDPNADYTVATYPHPDQFLLLDHTSTVKDVMVTRSAAEGFFTIPTGVLTGWRRLGPDPSQHIRPFPYAMEQTQNSRLSEHRFNLHTTGAFGFQNRASEFSYDGPELEILDY